ncbi:MAG: hypothetical protein J6W24_05225 [Prevotella sp.]|nr:hypothetical protein [Prevotella sp.]
MKDTLRHILLTTMMLLATIGAEAQQDSTALLSSTHDTAPLTKADSLTIAKVEKTVTKKVTKQKRDWTTWTPDPKKAVWWALIPGGGQIYNRKFWKLPIVYGGFLGCAYAIRWNNQMYQDYKQALKDLTDDDPSTESYNNFMHLGVTIDSDTDKEHYTNVFKNRKDKYRRWRDLSIFVTIGVYALSIIDAYVDASLSKFDISDDLSLEIEPAVIEGANKRLENSAIGVHGALTF